jgi:hypothetical protein
VGEDAAASPTRAGSVLSNSSVLPKDLPQTGSRLDSLRRGDSRWIITALLVIIAVLLSLLVRTTRSDDNG